MNTSTDKPVYKLLKDLPDMKAGQLYIKVLEPAGTDYYIAVYKYDKNKAAEGKIYTAETVENNPDFFQLQQLKEEGKRIIIDKIGWLKDNDHGTWYSFSTNGKINPEKYEAVKQDISDCLNKSKIVCRIQIGMEIEYNLISDWKMSGTKDVVKAFDMQEGKVWLSKGSIIGIKDFLEKIDSGCYKVTYYPTPLPENKQPVDIPKSSKVMEQVGEDWVKRNPPQQNKEKDWVVTKVEYCSENRLLINGGKIFSVLRKSDNSVVELHKTKVLDPNTKHEWTVSEITLKDGWIYLNGVRLNHVEIISETKVTSSDSISCTNTEEEKPLFTTEDGVEIKKVIGFVWFVNYVYSTSERSVFDTISILKEYEGKEINFKLFSTKEAASKWVLHNKPQFTFNDIRKACEERHFIGVDFLLEKLVNQKISL